MATNPDRPHFPRQQARRLPSRLRLPRRKPLREALLAAFARTLAVARRASRDAEADPARSVHDFRKAIRRARAVVALLRPSLGRPAAEGILAELRRAFGETGARRDADILLATLGSVASEDPARAAIEQALAAEQEARNDPAETAQMLRKAVRILAPLPGALGVTLARAFSVGDLERGLSRSCRRVHDTLELAASTGLETDLHEWRKRTKELRYQIELLASTGSSELGQREKRLAGLAVDLGRVTDLIVLAGELERRQRDGTLPEAPGLIESIRRAILDRSGELLHRGQELFTGAPRDFARQVLAERG